jgi:atrophin-1 interacting protein 3 (BAI1-associated protein 1)
MAEESKNNDLNPIINNGNVNNRIVESNSVEFGLMVGNKKTSITSDDTRSLDGILSNGSGSLNRRMRKFLLVSTYVRMTNNCLIPTDLGRPPLVPYYHTDHLVLIQNSAEDDHLGPLPPKWEKAYTDNGEAYFIDHNSGTSHWLDPRLSKFQKKKLEECDENELPFGWEKISDPHYGQYFIDHVNRKTQYENPVLQAKRLAERRAKEEMEKAYKFTKNPSELCGERISTTLLKSARGLGFTIVGGDDNVEEFLQIKSIVPNGPAWLDGKLKTGDILVYVNDICVLGFTHHEMVNIFQSILAGELVNLDICRGYPLPFDPNDPNTEVVTTIAVDGINSDAEKSRIFMDLNLDGNYNFLDLSDQATGGQQQKNPLAKIQGGSLKTDSLLTTINSANNNSFEIPEILTLTINKGPMGFGFTIADTNGYGQKVKKILDRQCCTNLQEGDLLLSINSISVKMMSHNDVVQVLKECPKNQETALRVQRGALPANVNRFTSKLRKVGDFNKYGTKKEQMHANLFRSKTPTADFYSQGQREPQPSRPKTPLVDTRNRAACKTPLNELNPEAIELEAAADIIEMPTSKSLDLQDVNNGVADTKSNHSYADHDSINNDSTTYVDANYPKIVSNLSDRMNDVNLSDARSDSLYVEPPHLKPIKSSLFGQLDPKTHHYSANPPTTNGYYQKYDGASSILQPLATGGHYIAPPIPTYHHESCFCYDCQEYSRRLHDYNLFVQQQQQQQQQQPPPPHSPTANQQYSLPPQMSDNIGKRIHDYINDRRRILGNTPTSNMSYNTNDAMMDGFNYNNNIQQGNWSWGQGGNQPSPSGMSSRVQVRDVFLSKKLVDCFVFYFRMNIS